MRSVLGGAPPRQGARKGSIWGWPVPREVRPGWPGCPRPALTGADGSIEYWFRCMDLDGDGALSMFELQYFYEEQCRRLDSMAIEALPFEDCLCQMLDLVKPQREGNGPRVRRGSSHVRWGLA